MKLLSHYYRANIIATIIVVILSSIGYFIILHFVLIQQLDGSLEVEEAEVTAYLASTGRLPQPSAYKDQQVKFAAAPNGDLVRRFSSITVYDPQQEEDITVRQLQFLLIADHKPWYVFISKSQEETEDLAKFILVITLVLLIALLLMLFLINRFVLRRLWKPFDSTLAELKAFNLAGNRQLQLEPTEINEFRELNQVVTLMTNKISLEFDALKAFTDNASHELQTPLAVINAKVDVLIQSEHINEYQMEQLQGIYTAVDRMSKLNQSLLLLARIENNQYDELNDLLLHTALEEKLTLFEEMVASRGLIIKKDVSPVQVKVNKYLADVLLNNLLSNAIRHNKIGGTISITARDHELLISNTSTLPELDKSRLFQRFYRHENTINSGNGLGLSIIWQICQDAGYQPGYYFKDDAHHFHVVFTPPTSAA